MARIESASLPADSLLAQHRGAECYRDAFRTEVSHPVSLTAFIAAFYASPAFTPERKLLRLIGKGADRADIAALAEGRSERFAAWSVEARSETSILLRDFQNRTCSWLMAEPKGESTVLWFGSGVRHPEGLAFRVLVGFHGWYSRVLLAAAVRKAIDWREGAQRGRRAR